MLFFRWSNPVKTPEHPFPCFRRNIRIPYGSGSNNFYLGGSLTDPTIGHTWNFRRGSVRVGVNPLSRGFSVGGSWSFKKKRSTLQNKVWIRMITITENCKLSCAIKYSLFSCKSMLWLVSANRPHYSNFTRFWVVCWEDFGWQHACQTS